MSRELERIRAERERQAEVERANDPHRPEPGPGGWTTIASMTAQQTADWLAGPERPAPMAFHDSEVAAQVEAVMETVRRVVDAALKQGVNATTLEGRLQFAGMMADALEKVKGEQTAARIRELSVQAKAGNRRSEELLQVLIGSLLQQAGLA